MAKTEQPERPHAERHWASVALLVAAWIGFNAFGVFLVAACGLGARVLIRLTRDSPLTSSDVCLLVLTIFALTKSIACLGRATRGVDADADVAPQSAAAANATKERKTFIPHPLGEGASVTAAKQALHREAHKPPALASAPYPCLIAFRPA